MIVTFYSYKGGTGRTLALANVAVLLARQGHRVLAVDFDLEAPGLSRFLQSQAGRGVVLDERSGLLDLCRAVSEAGHDDAGSVPDWREYVTTVSSRSGSLSLMTSGRRDEDYPARLLGFDWDLFFGRDGGGDFIEDMRAEWQQEYDFVLVDSRTGITDAGGICTIQLPDVIVAVFTANEQSVSGVVDVLARAERGRQLLAYDRAALTVVPLPSRFESLTEHEMAREWMDRFVQAFGHCYESWVPEGVSHRRVLERTALPYVPFFSYGEPLPVLVEGTGAPGSLDYALATVTRLIASRLRDVDEIALDGGRAGEVTPSVERVVAATEVRLRAAPPDLAERAWQVLARMVRVEVGDDGLIELAPGTFDLIDLPDLPGPGDTRPWLGPLLGELPAVRVVGESLVWSHESLPARWEALAERVDRDRDFLLWTQDLRRRSNGYVETVSGRALETASGWLTSRGDDLTRRERAFVDRSRRADRFYLLLGIGVFAIFVPAMVLAAIFLPSPPRIIVPLVLGVFLALGAGLGYYADWRDRRGS